MNNRGLILFLIVLSLGGTWVAFNSKRNPLAGDLKTLKQIGPKAYGCPWCCEPATHVMSGVTFHTKTDGPEKGILLCCTRCEILWCYNAALQQKQIIEAWDKFDAEFDWNDLRQITTWKEMHEHPEKCPCSECRKNC